MLAEENVDNLGHVAVAGAPRRLGRGAVEGLACMRPDIIYFDLGNVLLLFDHERACRQMAEVAGVDAAKVRRIVFDSDVEIRYEAGEISSREFYELFCRETGTRPDYDELARAAGDIFEVNGPIKPVVGGLASAGQRLGMLSNTCEIHWNWFSGDRFGIIPSMFEVIVLSFRVGAVKPDAKIFQAAAEMAGAAFENILYIDDVPGHVAAARRLGIDAIEYTTTTQLVEELRRRDVTMNY